VIGDWMDPTRRRPPWLSETPQPHLQLPQRLAAGEPEAALNKMAAGTYPFGSEVTPEQLVKALGTSEVLLGGALVLPLISDRFAGLALASFAGGLLGLYAKTRAYGTRGHSAEPTGYGHRKGRLADRHRDRVGGRRSQPELTAGRFGLVLAG
jgi:hypothetical protein